MITVLAHNITSPLGSTTSENFDAVASGYSAIQQYHAKRGIPGDFTASLFTDECLERLRLKGCSQLESIAIASAKRAVADANIDVSDGKTIFILSTTKGNIEWLNDSEHRKERVLPGSSAKLIARSLGIKTQPIVVDNACISGLSAIITACRLLEIGAYDNAVVCGAEIQSKFIISGFQSLKATSADPCRPFDIERNGLNLGEAAATIVLSRNSGASSWKIMNGCVKNDAFHLSAPSKTGEGAYQALTGCIRGNNIDDIAFINAHGTATLFNDQMESVAVQRAALNSIPVNGLKGYYGHTMGACGILETALSMEALDNDVILPTKGFEELGVSGKIDVVNRVKKTEKKSFMKMLSGFGGGNAAILVSKDNSSETSKALAPADIHVTHHIHIDSSKVEVDGKALSVDAEGKALLTELYKRYVGDYSRFYKMDVLCRLGFIATELLLKAEGSARFVERNDRAVIFTGHSGSIVADLNYQQSISNPADYFPSPERFVYTLPNIVTGEIAIRNHYHGETEFYLLDDRDNATMENIIKAAFLDSSTKSVIGGWLECSSTDYFEADLNIIEK